MMAWNVSLKRGCAYRQVAIYSAVQTAIVSNSRHPAPVSASQRSRLGSDDAIIQRSGIGGDE
jgi:hypothetical protein